MGSLLLTAGAPGHRMALPNSKIMLHQVKRATNPPLDGRRRLFSNHPNT